MTYTKQEVMVPMRDGVKLHTLIYTPVGQYNALPFLLTRTPYGANDIIGPGKNDYIADMAASGYLFVYQDIRGHYQSEGIYVMLRSTIKNGEKGIDESTDTYDTIDWLIKHVPNNNGKVGMYGISYDGWTTVMGTIHPHPALAAVSEQASPADMYMGDDFHHDGAFRLSYGFEYVFSQEAAKTDTLYQFPNYDTYDWYLKLGPLSNVNQKYFHNHLPTWNNFVQHPNYDAYWQAQAVPHRLDTPKVPIMNVAGWYDQEDFYGPLKIYETLAKKDRAHNNVLVVGPWNHGEWAYWPGDKLGNINFGSRTSDKFRQQIQAPWFAYYLKGQGDGNFEAVTSFQTGSDTWKSYKQWPPAEVVNKNIYLHAGGGLSFEKTGAATKTFDSYISDPAHPVPYRPRPIEETYGPGSRWGSWLTEDQRFVKDRPDVMSWQTNTLTHDLTVTGKIMADIYAATSGSDADWIVKVIDVYPEKYAAEPKMAGYELMVANEVLRGRFRKSFEKPEPITPGKVEAYTIDLHSIDHVFKKGHRIMVQVQSTWFPIIDRNPQKYVPNIFKAKETDFVTAVQKIYSSAACPSHIVLPVIE